MLLAYLVGLASFAIIVILWVYLVFQRRNTLGLLEQQSERIEMLLEFKNAQSELTAQIRRQTLQLQQQQTQLGQENEDLKEICQLQQELSETLQHKIQLLEDRSQENKLYLRAKRMLALGADIDEIMTECQISRAEAELMVSMQASPDS